MAKSINDRVNFSQDPITNDEIKVLLCSGEKCKEIAKTFGVHQQRVAALKGVLLRSGQLSAGE